jgi:hypothetical protein
VRQSPPFEEAGRNREGERVVVHLRADARSDRPIFIGLASADELDRYLHRGRGLLYGVMRSRR